MSKENYLRFLDVSKQWLADVDKYNEQPFVRRVDKKWSVGDIYEFVIRQALDVHIPAMKRCMEGGEKEAKGKNFKGVFAYIRGAYPVSHTFKNIKPKEPESVEHVRNGLLKILKLMEEHYPLVNKTDKKVKVGHPYYGGLNAIEWYKLTIVLYEQLLKEKYKADYRLSKK